MQMQGLNAELAHILNPIDLHGLNPVSCFQTVLMEVVFDNSSVYFKYL